ncbi:prepilin peptidase [Pendulispora albinea]|uniref:A24 family peptidase n=1 Tax=Pendulispora albinea TaxID=2741071 RepID=A0ABZ2LXY9_9BACT
MVHISMSAAIAALGLALLAAAFELRTKRIPNLLVLPAIPLAGLLGIVDGAWADHAFGLLAGIIVGIIAYSREAVGGGLLKLMAAVSGFLGIQLTPVLMAAVALAFPVAAFVLGHFHVRKRADWIVGSPFVVGACIVALLADRFLP